MRLVGEDRLIDWLRAQEGCGRIGDDAAVLPRDTFAVTTDTQVAGVHVEPTLDPAHVARRLLAVNASDLAAMGAVPAFAFSVIAAPPGFDHRRFLAALVRASKTLGVELAGGDLSSSPVLVTMLTMIGRRPPGGRWLTRDRARPGDRIWLGGTIGEARLGLRAIERGATVTSRGGVRLPPALEAAGRIESALKRAVRRHLLPRPQLALGQWLASQPFRPAAIDLSDGLARDLHRLCRQSGVGARIDHSLLPSSPRAQGLAAMLAIDLEEAMVFGGEDYVLCFTMAPTHRPPARFGCVSIGRIREQAGIEIDGLSNNRSLLPDRGFDHLAREQKGP